MLKVVKRPKEYIAIKVPENCNKIGKFVRKEALKAGISLNVFSYYTGAYVGSFFEVRVSNPGGGSNFVQAGSVIVCELCEDDIHLPKDIFVMSQEKFDAEFKSVDEPIENINTPIHIDTDPILDQLKNIKAEMSTKIKGVTLSDDLKFSESFIAELDKALNEYHQKQGQSSQHTSTPHVRIEFDDINDVPHVWIDGKYISSFPDHGLVRLNIEWNADDEHVNPKHYNIEYRNGEDANQYQYTGIGQTNDIN